MTKKRKTLSDFYKESDLKEKIDWVNYKDIWGTFADLLVKDLIKNGSIYKLPHRLGTISVRKSKTKKTDRKVDFYKTKKYGTTIYHNNEHSDGYYGYFSWNTELPYGCFTNKMLYKFKPTRANSRYLSAQISNSNTILNYFEN